MSLWICEWQEGCRKDKGRVSWLYLSKEEAEREFETKVKTLKMLGYNMCHKLIRIEQATTKEIREKIKEIERRISMIERNKENYLQSDVELYIKYLKKELDKWKIELGGYGDGGKEA